MKFKTSLNLTLNKMRNLLIWCLLTLPIILIAQPVDCISERYQKKVFNNIDITSNITYGNAQNVIGFNQSLELDFYEPASTEEYLTKRPLVVMLFGGAYVLGNKADADMRAWCDSLAHYGYACASVEYRLDNVANFALPDQGIRAAYRAIQDGRAAIRYLLEDPSGFGFNIDPAHIYVGGESAGAISAINIGYLEEAERPAETYSINFFNPDLGCLDCSGNNFVQPFTIAGIIDLWGATIDLDYIDAAENIPMVIIHGDQDNVVPFDTGPPFGVPTFPTFFGAVPLDAEMTAKNICHQFFPYPGQGHVIYGIPTGVVTFPNQFWAPIFTQGHQFLYDKTMRFNSPIPTGALMVCENDIETYQVPATAGSIYCWDAVNGTIISTNNNQVTVQWNNGPGFLTLTETNCIDVVGVAQTIEVLPTSCCAPISLNIFFDGFPSQSSWDIVDANGNMVANGNSYGSVASNSSIVESTCLPDGCYTLNFYDALNNGMCPFQSSGLGVSTFITPGTLITAGSIVGTLSLVASPGLCGNYNLTDALGNTLANGGGGFGSQQSNSFCISGGLAPKTDNTIKNDFKINSNELLLKIFPTATTGILNIEFNNEAEKNIPLKVIDLSGRTVKLEPLVNTSSSYKINVNNLPNGNYILQVLNNNKIESRPFVKF